MVDHPGAGMRRTRGVLLFTATAALTAYPPLRALLEHGSLGAFRYLADDSFYYLTVAARSVGKGFFTFDGIHPTNGFHPLWQILLEQGSAWLRLDSVGRVYLAVTVGIVLVTLGTTLFAVAAWRMTGRPALALLAAVPGPFYLLVPGLESGVGAPWSFVNGMESPLSICFFGLLLVSSTGRAALEPGNRYERRGLLVLSALLTLLTMSRLDDVFLFVPFLLYVAWRSDSRAAAARRLALVAALPTFVLGGYLAYNQVFAGSLLPSSGASKAAPLWALARNAYAVFTTLAPFPDVLHRGRGQWEAESWRVAQMLVPAVVAAAWLLSRGLPSGFAGEDAKFRHESLLGLLAGYVVLKAAYNFTTVPLWQQGHWYYPVSIMTCNLIFAVAVSRQLDEVRATGIGAFGSGRWLRTGRLPMAAACVLALWSANAFVDRQDIPRPRDRRHVFWSERKAIEALLARDCPDCGVLSFDDGIVAYSLPGTSTLNGLGLTMDAEALQARREGRLLDLAWSRGVRLIASVIYELPDEAFSSPKRLRSQLEAYPHLRGQDLARWRFEVAFVTPASGVHFIRFEPAEADDRPVGRAPRTP